MKLYTQSECVCVRLYFPYCIKEGLGSLIVFEHDVWKRIRANFLNSAFQKFENGEQICDPYPFYQIQPRHSYLSATTLMIRKQKRLIDSGMLRLLPLLPSRIVNSCYSRVPLSF